MTKFHNLPLNRKLAVIIFLTTMFAMFLSAVAIISYQTHTFTQFIVSELETTAEMLSANGAVALRFDVSRDAEQTLLSLKAKSHINSAFIFTPDQKLFAKYTQENTSINLPPFPLEEGHTFEFGQNYVILIKHIYHDTDFIGTLYLQSNLDIFYSNLKQSIAVTLLIIISCSLLALVLAFQLLRSISYPITHLVDVANRVSKHRNYSLRAKKFANDDLGALTEEFNDMLHQIQKRDADLQQEINERNKAESSLQKAYSELQIANKDLKREVRERQQAEEARKQAEEELEDQRTLSIRSDRLRSLGEMAAGMAHELNQPLVGVRGISEHILIGIQQGWELTQEDLKDRVTDIVEQADRMVHIIQHVRLFAREAGKPDLSPVQVNDVVKSSIDMVSAQYKSHGLELECNLADDLPLVLANPFSLEEVILNLLNNARDALEEGNEKNSECVLIHTKYQEEATPPSIQIQIQDTGPGIPKDILDKIFDPFFTTKGPDKGTGLGLAISKSIVEECGGTLQIQSSPKQGTTAIVSLPIINQ